MKLTQKKLLTDWKKIRGTIFKEIAVKFETPYISVLLLYKVLIRSINISKLPSPDAKTIISDLLAYSIISIVIPTSQSPFEDPSERLMNGFSLTSKPMDLRIF